jgi:hypothetical protein
MNKKANAQESEVFLGGVVGVPEARRRTGMSNSWWYWAMETGLVDYVSIGRRKLVPVIEIDRVLREGLIKRPMASSDSDPNPGGER